MPCTVAPGWAGEPELRSSPCATWQTIHSDLSQWVCIHPEEGVPFTCLHKAALVIEEGCEEENRVGLRILKSKLRAALGIAKR